MGRHSFAAGQLRKPSGLYGKYVIARFMNKANTDLNARVLAALSLQSDDEVLEVGFGGGGLIERIAPRLGDGMVAGVDYSETMVSLCGRRFASHIAAGRVELSCAAVESLPFKNDSFSKACTVNTIYFWANPTVSLNEIRRVLRPDGRLVVGFVPRETMSKYPQTEYGFTLYDADQVAGLMSGAGFSDVELIAGSNSRGEFACAVGRKGAED